MQISSFHSPNGTDFFLHGPHSLLDLFPFLSKEKNLSLRNFKLLTLQITPHINITFSYFPTVKMFKILPWHSYYVLKLNQNQTF